MSAPVICGIDLWKTHRSGKSSLDVLRGVSVEIQGPQIIAILGPSGAGKTTLLNLLSGLDQPSRGDVKFDGKPLSRMSGRERAQFLNKRAGFVFQFYHLLGDLTALENVMLPATIGGMRKKDAIHRAESLLEEVGLSARKTHYPSELSGGEQQRVAIARALVNDPETLFCDEPTGNLDSATGRSVCEYLQRLSVERHKTILIVTHDDKIAQMAGRVLRLKDGRWDNQ